jgi:hypothetical protein
MACAGGVEGGSSRLNGILAVETAFGTDPRLTVRTISMSMGKRSLDRLVSH